MLNRWAMTKSWLIMLSPWLADEPSAYKCPARARWPWGSCLHRRFSLLNVASIGMLGGTCYAWEYRFANFSHGASHLLLILLAKANLWDYQWRDICQAITKIVHHELFSRAESFAGLQDCAAHVAVRIWPAESGHHASICPSTSCLAYGLACSSKCPKELLQLILKLPGHFIAMCI